MLRYARANCRAIKRILAPRYLAYIKGCRGVQQDQSNDNRFGFFGFSCLPGTPGSRVACFMGFRGLLVVVLVVVDMTGISFMLMVMDRMIHQAKVQGNPELVRSSGAGRPGQADRQGPTSTKLHGSHGHGCGHDDAG